MPAPDEPKLRAGVITLRFELPAATLKEKRSLIRPVVERLKSRFNASVVEAGPPNDPRTSVVAAICLSTDHKYLQGQMQAILRFVEGAKADAVLVDVSTEDFVL